MAFTLIMVTAVLVKQSANESRKELLGDKQSLACLYSFFAVYNQKPRVFSEAI